MTARRVHLVYPHGDAVASPDAIGRELGKRLAETYEVVYHGWTDRATIDPEPGDVLLGHPHPDPRTVFRASLERPGWSRRLMLAPFHHGDLPQVAFEDSIVPKCDLFLAITGPYWFRTVETSRCSHWRPKMVHLDNAVDPADFPRLKTAFAPPGKRRFVYVGHTGRGKATPYLDEIAARLPDVEFCHVGSGGSMRSVRSLGFQDFRSEASRELLATFDFLITVGNADANPTTILEAMAWGLVPVCTPTSGYEADSGVVNVPYGDPAAAAEVIRGLQGLDERELLAMQEANWTRIREQYTWDRFASNVRGAIESTESPAMGPESLARRIEFRAAALAGPYGPIERATRRGRRLRGLRRGPRGGGS